MSNESALALAQGSTDLTPNLNVSTQDNDHSTVGVEDSGPGTSESPAPSALKSKAFVQLARKEADLQRQRQEVAAEREKIQAAAQEYQKYLQLKQTDPVAALKVLGFSETDIFNYMAANQPVELSPEEKAAKAAESATEARIKAFEDAQAKKQQEAQEQADKRVIDQYRDNVAKIITGNPLKFEYCAYHGPAAQELIYETVKAIVDSSQGADVPTPEEAALLVEQFYEEEDKTMSTTIKKRQPKIEDQPLKAEVSPRPPERSRTLQQGPARTLPPRATATVASTTKMTETFAQKRERLIEKLKNGGF
jgi:hypothetical protein